MKASRKLALAAALAGAVFARVSAADPVPLDDSGAVTEAPPDPEPEPAAPAPPSAAGIANIPQAALDAARQARHLPLPERLEAVSRPFLGTPYLLDPLGEGEDPDPDPIARYDAFDCLTFVEEALALALAGDPAHAAAVRNALRYGATRPAYADRRHFMELQWIPRNEAEGWIRNVAATYGETVRMEREVSAATWRAWGRRALFRIPDEKLPVGTMALDIVPLERAIAIADTVRPGTIVMAVRVDRPWIPLWIGHFGFTVPSDGAATFRHATRVKSGPKVRDQSLVSWLKAMRNYQNWPAAGVALYEPVEQGPRIVQPR